MNNFFIVVLTYFWLLLTNNMSNLSPQFEEIIAKLTYTEELLVNSKRIIYEYSVQNNINVSRIEYLEQRVKYYQTSEELKLQPDNRDEKIADLYSKICLYTDKVNMYRVQAEDRGEKIIDLEKKLQIAKMQPNDLNVIQNKLNEECVQKKYFEEQVEDRDKKIIELEKIIGKCVPMENANSLIKDHKEEIIDLSDKIILLQAKLKDCDQKIIDFEEKISVRDSQLQNRDEVTTHLKNKIITLENQLKDRDEVMNDLKIDFMEERMQTATMEKTIEDLKKNLEGERILRANYEDQLQSRFEFRLAEDKSNIIELESSLKDKRIQIATMEKTIEEKKIMIIDLMNKHDKTKMKLKEAEELNWAFELSMKDVDIV